MPLSQSEIQIRRRFETFGHVVTVRIVPNEQGKPILYGFVDYLEAHSAQSAVAKLNGVEVSGMRLSVDFASRKKRARTNNDAVGGVSGDNDGKRGDDSSSSNLDFSSFPRELTSNIICEILKGVPVREAYEAVQQLRTMCCEQPVESQAFLDHNPHLKYAVTLILMHEGRLPVEPLKDEALSKNSSAPTAAKDPVQGRANDGGVPSSVISEEQVTKLLSTLSEEKIDRILKMKKEDFAKIPNSVTRKQMAALQKRLLEMTK